jgi:hypothetical protein
MIRQVPKRRVGERGWVKCQWSEASDDEERIKRKGIMLNVEGPFGSKSACMSLQRAFVGSTRALAELLAHVSIATFCRSTIGQ